MRPSARSSRTCATVEEAFAPEVAGEHLHAATTGRRVWTRANYVRFRLDQAPDILRAAGRRAAVRAATPPARPAACSASPTWRRRPRDDRPTWRSQDRDAHRPLLRLGARRARRSSRRARRRPTRPSSRPPTTSPAAPRRRPRQPRQPERRSRRCCSRTRRPPGLAPLPRRAFTLAEQRARRARPIKVKARSMPTAASTRSIRFSGGASRFPRRRLGRAWRWRSRRWRHQRPAVHDPASTGTRLEIGDFAIKGALTKDGQAARRAAKTALVIVTTDGDALSRRRWQRRRGSSSSSA